MYLYTTFFFFLIGGALALLVRTQLASASNTFLTPTVYNQVFSMHGTTMIFLFVIPMWSGWGNYIVPLQIGARDMAFPRINAFSFWLIPLGGLILFAGFFVPPTIVHGATTCAGGPGSAGWTGYVPLTEKQFSCSMGQDLWILGLHVLGVSSMLGGVNFLVTIINMRAPGMKLFRMPLFTWSILITAFLVVLASPFLAAALAMVLADREFGTAFFQPNNGGSAIIYQVIFWFYSHPAVYIMVLPAFGIISEVIPVFSKKPVFGYKAMAYSMSAIAILGFVVFVHHMFTVGLPLSVISFFSFTSMCIAVPSGVKVLNWLATMWGGSIRYTASMLFAVGAVLDVPDWRRGWGLPGLSARRLPAPRHLLGGGAHPLRRLRPLRLRYVQRLLLLVSQDHRQVPQRSPWQAPVLDAVDRLQRRLPADAPPRPRGDAPTDLVVPGNQGMADDQLHRDPRRLSHRGEHADLHIQLREDHLFHQAAGPHSRRSLGGQHPRVGHQLATARLELRRGPGGAQRPPGP